jgi:hypothetical protein
MVEEDLLVTRVSSSTQTSPRSCHVATAACHSYVIPQTQDIGLILIIHRPTRTTASTSRAFPPHPTLLILPATLLLSLRLTSTLSTQRLAPLNLSSLTLADLLSRDRSDHNVL